MLRNVLIPAVVALAALHAAGLANPVRSVMPAPEGAAAAAAGGACPARPIVAAPANDGID